MAKEKETESDADRKAREAAEERKAAIAKIIAALPRSCSHDMDESAIFGRCIGRLKDWGASDAEIGEAIPKIREVAASYVSKREAVFADQAQRTRARNALAAERALDAALKG